MKEVKKIQTCGNKNTMSEKNQDEHISISIKNCELDLPKLLLHSCCGPCSTSVIERLIEHYDITLFFFNPNIVNEEEYLRRIEAQKKVLEGLSKKANIGKVGWMQANYSPKIFHNNIKGLEKEAEGGKRCKECILLRMEETASKASIHKFDAFATTLTVSPHKDYKMISKIGNFLASKYNVGFLDEDFKKRDGFKRSIELSKKLDLYRQSFCGCKYSV